MTDDNHSHSPAPPPIPAASLHPANISLADIVAYRCGSATGALTDRAEVARARLMARRQDQIEHLHDLLHANYPVTRAALSDGVFRDLCATYVRDIITLYDGWGSQSGFAAHCQAHPPLGAFPYLYDLVQLEWAICQSRKAASAYRLEMDDLLLDEGELPVALHPSVHILHVGFDVLGLHQAFHAAGVAVTEVAPASDLILVWRDRNHVPRQMRLSPRQDQFLSSLLDTENLCQTFKDLNGRDQNDLYAFLGDVIRDGLFVAAV
ncbi:putative DNA-binding domain-containing protein [Asticcacaulis endophyticus]|uniref:DNA-binding domain-containing protein n=1 Tax=Asticcacaulis endophyticus TaxID=1395890 RepID=A0A918UQZ4_9CAUL|nr:putative DNA-binding domain-containing protein [Asticcacaulis endophyticus]GGZ28268.1 hypothetical protein GCM10011273_12570 [Asticcacaulis endophyticus]